VELSLVAIAMVLALTVLRRLPRYDGRIGSISRRRPGDGGKLDLHAGAQSRRRALCVAVAPMLALLGCALVLGQALSAAAHRQGAAHSIAILADPAARLAIAAHSFGWVRSSP